ncbi:hypothetical protein GOP47_0016300 [Adiantum capillus-veneris]|uniref:Cation efflux protein cytoplasmic domain-containing protein n=1 Tax=Adiantum capillus-veneris TaxID=13818 RepID=A0A9D4UHF2_ADICA|nr:hypothetical protein GOP47_0016300 [Adiantum capillus-veneris]
MSSLIKIYKALLEHYSDKPTCPIKDAIQAPNQRLLTKLLKWGLELWKLRRPLNVKASNKALGSPYCLTPVCQGRNTRLESYYNEQNEILKEMATLDGLSYSNQNLVSALGDDQANSRGKDIFAIRISNYANMAIFIIKVYVSIRSVSLAIIASTLDSLLDLLSGFILWYTSHTMRRPNPYLYPIGKNRMQPVGILVFASIMATLGIQILIESTRQLISKSNQLELQGTNKYWVIGVMLFVTLVKFNLMLLCKSIKNDIVQAYAKDHFFDVVTNLVGLAAALLAERFYWWIDPIGAIMLALYTIWNWSKIVLENVSALVGESAPPQFLQKITYLCWNHHEAIKHIDTIKAYKLGGLYFAEVDIVLPGDMPLLLAHDIGESLQNKLECLPDIERAFVHLDYEFSHRPEHAPKKFLV